MKIRLKSFFFICVLSVTTNAQGEWSNSTASSIVGELLDNLKQLIAVADDAGRQSDAVRNKFSHAAMVDLKQLAGEVDRLDLALAAGKGHAQTFAQYQRISNLRYSIKNYAEDIEIPDDIRKVAESADSLLRQLEIIYIE